jgi:hypothetical protein
MFQINDTVWFGINIHYSIDSIELVQLFWSAVFPVQQLVFGFQSLFQNFWFLEATRSDQVPVPDSTEIG